MLLGVGSPGTVQEVVRGYVGDRDAPEVFAGGSVFDVLGSGYQRPFELASRRLLNMASILPRWRDLAPADAGLLTAQGGTFVFADGETCFAHRIPSTGPACVLCFERTHIYAHYLHDLVPGPRPPCNVSAP